MNGNLRFGQLFGIPFFVNPSWFLVLALGTFSFAQSFIRIPSIGSLGGLAWGGAIALGLLTTLLLFASVLAHELGHSAAAIAQGIEVKSITLFIFGGLAMLEKDASTPMKSLAIAIAGPLVSFALFFLFFFTQRGLQGLPLPVTVILTTLASLNLVLGLFNLIPGMPLDGGNILRAIIWQVTGNASTGLLYASRVGQGFGGFAIALGLLGEFGISPYGSLWTAFIGAFLLQNAGRSAQSAQVQNKLNQYRAEDAMISAPIIVTGDRNLRSFVNDFVIGKDPVPFYIVTDEQGKYLGIIQADDLKTIATSLWTDITLLDVLRDRSGKSETIHLTQIQGQTPLLELVPLIEQNPNQPLLVLNEQDQALGLLTKTSIRDRLVADNPPSPKSVEPSAE